MVCPKLISWAFPLTFAVFGVFDAYACRDCFAWADPALFSSIDTATADLTPKQQKILERINASMGTVEGSSKVVRMNSAAASSAADSPFEVTLPHGKKTLGFRTAITHLPNGEKNFKVLAGRSDKSNEAAYVELTDNAATGLIYSGDKVFAVEPIGGGLQAITEIDMSKFDMHGHSKKFEELEKKPIPARDLAPSPSADAPPVDITVLVCYTPKVESLQASMPSLINASVALANTSYTNSKVNLRLQLVGSHKVDYTETTTHDDDLASFRLKTDGKMDEIHGLRDMLKADICVLLIDNDAFCGLAAAILADKDTAFAVVHHDCAVKNLSFTHEIGHLQGARHNLAADPTIDPTRKYNHGYLSAGSANWRTIMAYPAPGKPNRLPYWSNPGVKIDDIATGTEENENNARILNETAKTVSQFR